VGRPLSRAWSTERRSQGWKTGPLGPVRARHVTSGAMAVVIAFAAVTICVLAPTSSASGVHPNASDVALRPPAETATNAAVVAVAFSLTQVEWEATSGGVVIPVGNAPSYGSTGSLQLNRPIVGMAATPDGHGYWLVASDGGVFSFGDARFYGSLGSIHLNQPIVGMAATPDGRGYWLVASDGGVFAVGDARFYGSLGSIHLNQPIVGMAATPDGRGYWLVASDGGVFSFGDAGFYGSGIGQGIRDQIIAISPSSDGLSYRLIGSDGTSYQFNRGAAANLNPSQSTPAGSTGEPSPTPATSAIRTSVSNAAASLLTSDVNTLVAHQAPGNPAGLWIGGDPVYWRASSGPGLAAAAVAGLNGNPTMQYDAIETFNTLISDHAQPNGSFTAVAGTPDPQSPDIDTMFFVTNLGMALWALRPKLSAQQNASWTNAITGGADYLVANGNLSWYTNGNIAIGSALVMALAYWASGDPKYQQVYAEALSFAISPPQSRWPGFGLIYTKVPNEASGADGAGYFAESGGAAPGFDADYTQLQLDQLCRLYLVTKSAEVLRLVELLFNQEWPLVNPTTWTLNTSGGTRHPQQGRFTGFTTPALVLLALDGGRTDLTQYVDKQSAFIDQGYAGAVTYWSAGAYYGFGVEAATLVLLGL
jgi:hypothetical protein